MLPYFSTAALSLGVGMISNMEPSCPFAAVSVSNQSPSGHIKTRLEGFVKIACADLLVSVPPPEESFTLASRASSTLYASSLPSCSVSASICGVITLPFVVQRKKFSTASMPLYCAHQTVQRYSQ